MLRRQNNQCRITKNDKKLMVSLQNLKSFRYTRVSRGFAIVAYSLQIDFKLFRELSCKTLAT